MTKSRVSNNLSTKAPASSPRQRARGRQPDGQPNKIDIYIGSRIRLRRNTLKWSQEKLADLLGLTFQQIQKYEKAQNRVPASRLYDIALVLGVHIDYFYQDIPPEARAQSPRFIATDAVFSAEDTAAVTVEDPLKSSRIQELVNSFIRIPNPQVADKLFELMEVLPASYYKAKTDKKEK